MSDFAKNFISKHKEWLNRTEEYLDSSDWHLEQIDQTTDDEGYYKVGAAKTLTSNKEAKLKNDKMFVSNIASRLKYFISKTAGEKHLDTNKDIRHKLVDIVYIFLDNCDYYIDNNNLQDIANQDLRNIEIKFQDLVFNTKIKIEDDLEAMGAQEDYEEVSVVFFKKEKASLIMREPLVLTNPDIKLKCETIMPDWNTGSSQEMLINMNPKDIPPYNHNKHFFEQDLSTIQFWQEEYNKMKNGLNINGYHLHPWMYHHLNIFKTKIPVSKNVEDIMNPPLRDNEWFFTENLKVAEEAGDRGLLLYGTRRFSKALRDDQILYYTDGSIRPIGEAKIGDQILGSDGKSTNIECVSPQGEVDIYKVSFQDGRESYCCEDHLWSVFDYQSQLHKVLPLKELLANGGYKYTRKRKNERADSTLYKYFIPISKPVEYKKIKLPIDPYYIGLWIGDGTSANADITTEDKEIKEYIKNLALKFDLEYKESDRRNETVRTRMVKKLGSGKTNPIKEILKNLNILNNKHIPEIIFTSHYDDRLAVLQGLLDTDGTISKGGSLSFTSSVKHISDQTARLARSLGIHCYIQEGEGQYTKQNGNVNTFYKVVFFTNKPVFRLSRKLDRIDRKPNPSRTSKMNRVAITDITKVGRNTATCIRVSNENREFLTNDYIVTHNSTIMASYIEWKLKTKANSVATLNGGNESDLIDLLDKVDTSMLYSPEAFKLIAQKTEGERTNGTTHLGLKLNAKDLLDFSQMQVKNLASGRKSSSQKTAGGAPSAFVVDEIGKFAFLKAYLAALPSFATPYGYKCVPILSGTGGEADLSIDAMTVLGNPEGYNLIPMDWDMLESKLDPDEITWNRRTFATFMPGQMGYEVGFKYKERPFGEFLGIKNATELNKIEIKQADFRNNNKVLDEILAKAEEEKGSKGKVLVEQKKVQNPRDPEDCFITIIGNPFPSEEAKIQKKKVIETGDTGRKVILQRDAGGNIYAESAEHMPLADFPHPGGFIDAPVQLFEELPTTPPPYGLYVAGLDDYKHDQSDGDSVGTMYIYKRQWFDPYSLTLVATYAARPTSRATFDRQCYYMLKAFNAICFHENEDNNFKTYLDNKHETENYLAKGLDFSAELNLANNGNRKYGWGAIEQNIDFGYSLIKKYLEKEVEVTREDGTKFTVLGVQRIKDVGLLEEIQNFTKDGNFDRLRAFMGALMYSHYLDATHNYPTPYVSEEERAKRKANREQKKKLIKKPNPFRTQNRGGYFRG